MSASDEHEQEQDQGRRAVDTLVRVGEDLNEDFQRKRRVLSFEEYYRLVAEEPAAHLRDSACYVRDTFDHFGSYEVSRAAGPIRRFRLFDSEYADGRDRLAGHEDVQNAIYRILGGFVRQGRPSKLILLHGPNGSAKSTCVAAIARAMEHYSRLNEGALYRFNWVFPSGLHAKGGIGFGTGAKGGRLESYAYLPEEHIDARLPDELRDHPLLLIPKSRRSELLDGLLADKGVARPLPDNLRYGDLSHRNREIFDAMLTLYHGDFHAVLRHVQVERFFLSRRYRAGLIVVEPKLSVDARTQQITADRSIEALPPALKTTALFRYSGELVDANRGIIEFSDLLKRPLESFKYLINTVELGRVGLENAILYLDEVFIGSSNDLHLRAFRELPDFPSFKGRIELVRVGYLLDQRAEAEIYENQFVGGDLHVAPHAIETAALWGVLTRLQKPSSAGHAEAIRTPIDKMTAMDKALLYSPGTLPRDVEGEAGQRLRAAIRKITEENLHSDEYEGHTGPSPREVRMALLNAAQDTRRGFLSPLAVMDELEALTQMQDVYPYLRRPPKPGGFQDAKAALQFVRDHYLEQLQEDLWSAVGLISKDQIDKIIETYVAHVSHWVKGEKMRNPITGAHADPDPAVMQETEAHLLVEDATTFRKDVITRIAGWAMTHPERRPDLDEIFAKEKRQIVQGLFHDRRGRLIERLKDTLHLLENRLTGLDDSRTAAARDTVAYLTETHAYNEASAEEAIRYYLQEHLD